MHSRLVILEACFFNVCDLGNRRTATVLWLTRVFFYLPKPKKLPKMQKLLFLVNFCKNKCCILDKFKKSFRETKVSKKSEEEKK
jgi:hypothetical protein